MYLFKKKNVCKPLIDCSNATVSITGGSLCAADHSTIIYTTPIVADFVRITFDMVAQTSNGMHIFSVY